MKLSTWARQAGVPPRTAYRWFHAGRLPVAGRTGTFLVDPPAQGDGDVAVSARVPAAGQRVDVDRRVAGVVGPATAVGLAPLGAMVGVGSAACGNRPTLWRLLADPDVATVAGEHRDRLARFGVEYVEASWAAQGRRSVVLDDGEVGDDLVGDMVEVGTSRCARLCGLGSARRRARRAVEAAGEVAA